MADSAVSRRVSEFTGVVLFGGSLLWVIALATYSATDPVWFFNDVASADVSNFAGRFGAFIALVSFQVAGYTAFLLPIFLGTVAWHYFWCKKVDAGYTKMVGALLFVTSLAGLLALAFAAFSGDGRTTAGGLIGNLASAALSTYLNRTGAAILLLTLLSLSVIVSTQFSFGRAFGAVAERVRETPGILDRWRAWREDKRRTRQRQQIVEKHVKNAGKERGSELATKAADAAEKLKAARARDASADVDEDDDDADVMRPRAARPAAAPNIKRPARGPVAQPLPLADAVPKSPIERQQDGYTTPPLSLLDAPKDHHKIDERELMDAARLLEEKSREFSVEGQVVQIHPGPVVTTYEFKPDAGFF